MNKRILSLGLAICCSFFLGGSSLRIETARAGIGDDFGLSPFADWKQIVTEHFRIVFPNALSPRAERVAQIYEEALRDMKGPVRWEPLTRVNVLLVDNSDSANGLTAPISRFGMLLYITSPDAYASIDQYDDWLKLLIYHEFTHFLNMDATRDFYTPLRWVFGDVLLPNSTWPSWMLEGYAVYDETKFTSAGRGRSPYWAGILRSSVETNTLNHSSFVTLDEINGTHPSFPGGETVYVFGYNLMNAVERLKPDALGEMTERSSSRIPYFINGNLKNITGKDWYAVWDSWVAETYRKMKAQLATLSSQPLSKVERFDNTEDGSFGIAFSPDQQWVSYSNANDDEWQTLKIRKWSEKADDARAVDDKFDGAGIVFTPDSRRVVYSSLHRWKNYNFYSDLRVYDVTNGDNYWITDGSRARDPDVSHDGKWIVYAVTDNSGTDLMLGRLVTLKNGRIQIDAQKKIVDAAPLERVGNPKFTPDTRGVVFSWKKSGKKSDDLYYYDFKQGKAAPIVEDGFANRFPAFDAKGSLYFVSDRTGVDNLYRYPGKPDLTSSFEKNAKSTLVTNVTGGLWLPTFRGDDLYASSLSKDGFSFAKVSMLPSVDPAKITVKIGEDAPTRTEDAIRMSASNPVPAHYSIQGYHPLPTLLPRQWAPVVISDINSTLLGGEVFGYDNIFEHQYFAYGAHNSTTKTWDYAVQYENRSFGPTLQLFAEKLTTDILDLKNSASGIGSYTRETQFGANLAFPFQGTTSRFTPSLGAHLERDFYYLLPPEGAQQLVGTEKNVPEQDAAIEFTNVRQSRLAVAPERGQTLLLGVRRYDLDEDVYKGIFKYVQYWNLGNHFSLSPTLKAMKVNRIDDGFLDSAALSRGKRNRVLNPLYSDNFDEFGIRGYPDLTKVSREAATLAMDLRFPVAQIFRGWGTNPLFLDRFWLQFFGEDTYRPSAPLYHHLASAGAGLRMDTEILLALPLTFQLNYDYGFNKDAGGQGELYFAISANTALPY